MHIDEIDTTDTSVVRISTDKEEINSQLQSQQNDNQLNKTEEVVGVERAENSVGAALEDQIVGITHDSKTVVVGVPHGNVAIEIVQEDKADNAVHVNKDVGVAHEEEAGSIPPQKQLAGGNTSQFSHPIYKKISATNGRINRMQKPDLIEALQYLNLSTKGTKEVLQKRLKVYTKKQCLKESNLDNSDKEKQYTDFYIVIDFEATCEEPNPPGFLHEIIEFPAVLVDAKTHSVVSEFHSYCRPEKNPELTDFCKQLTGISQVQVESASTFQTVLRRFDVWLKEQVNPQQTFVVATDGPWDINKFLKGQCKHLGIQIPYYFHRWVNVRKQFKNFYKLPQVNLELMLDHLDLNFVGRPHSGIDDSRNIARILIALIKDGADVVINETFR